MTIDLYMPGFKQDAESNFHDTCTITRKGTGTGEFNNETGQYDDPPRTTIYGPTVAPHFGKCRLQVRSISSGSTDSNAGEREAGVQESELQLPVDESTGNVAVGDVAEMVTCVMDPSLVGRQFTIASRHGKSQASARRLRVEEGTS